MYIHIHTCYNICIYIYIYTYIHTYTIITYIRNCSHSYTFTTIAYGHAHVDDRHGRARRRASTSSCGKSVPRAPYNNMIVMIVIVIICYI